MQRPDILESAGFNIYIDSKKLWNINIPIVSVPISELTWCFDLPLWEKDGTDDWNLTPWQVINKEIGTIDHFNKIQTADLSFPILITKNKERFVTLDGLHRIAKAYMKGDVSIQAKIFDKDSVEIHNARKQ